MPIKKYKPTTSGIRGMTVVDYALLTKGKPEKSLLEPLKKHAGRDYTGRISIRHRGAGVKRMYRLVELGPTKFFSGVVKTIEYDPNRSSFIALIEGKDTNGNPLKHYIIAPQELKIGDMVEYNEKTPVALGNRMKLRHIPTGISIYGIELIPSAGSRIARGAGTFAQILAKEGNYATVKLPSGEVRKIHLDCYGSVGSVSNPDHKSVVIAKAGRMRKMGWRPTVRGKAMYPAAHPHGGGEGVNPIGLKYPKTPWGKPARGVKTRRPRKPSDRFIVKPRRK